MTSSTAVRIFYVPGAGLWGDSAYTPEQPVMAVRQMLGGGDAARFAVANTIRGQSYDPGALSRK